MKDLQIPTEFKKDIETIQKELTEACYNYEKLANQLKDDPNNVILQQKISLAYENIRTIGIKQNGFFNKLREERKIQQQSLRTGIIKSSIEERRQNLNNSLNHARKQHIVARPAPVAVSSFSDDSIEGTSSHSSPEPKPFEAVHPNEITQDQFLFHFSLVTHDFLKEIKNKRAERKRRSTANPHFLYGNKGWDFPVKRKRNNCLSSTSPPNTRQAVKKKTERTSPTLPVSNGNCTLSKSSISSFPPLPNLPSGLTIERVSPTGSSPDSKSCVVCRQPGSLTTCDSCTNGFHISCHNRPLVQTPRQCPRCIIKEVRTVGSLNVPSGMSVSYVTPTEVAEKQEEKKELEKVNQTLSAELTQLQDRHSQLTISLKNQKSQQEELLMTQQSTEEKIKNILSFINDIKNGVVIESAQSQS